jgi:hypothetical protein
VVVMPRAKCIDGTPHVCSPTSSPSVKPLAKHGGDRSREQASVRRSYGEPSGYLIGRVKRSETRCWRHEFLTLTGAVISGTRIGAEALKLARVRTDDATGPVLVAAYHKALEELSL